MKLSKRLILLCIILVLFDCTIIVGQSPGYMGKKFSIFYEPSISPTITNHFTDQNYEIETQYNAFILNFQHAFSLDYVISRNIALGLSFKKMKSQIPGVHYTEEMPYVPGDHLYTYYAGDVNLNSKFASIYFKTFKFEKFGSIAPVGSFSKYEFMVGYVEGSTGTPSGVETIPEEFSESEYYDGLTGDFYPAYFFTNKFEELNFDTKTTVFALLYTWGKQSLFLDRIYLNHSFQLGWVMVATVNYTDAIVYGMGGGDLEESYVRDVNNRMQGALLFNLSLGIGFLAF
ncbi:MAG: hypothetical protein H7Y00_12375 [Fimbriimonadaceae bacterium]|nr:hypothetical protein [Chitinophagales bacterium]